MDSYMASAWQGMQSWTAGLAYDTCIHFLILNGKSGIHYTWWSFMFLLTPSSLYRTLTDSKKYIECQHSSNLLSHLMYLCLTFLLWQNTTFHLVARVPKHFGQGPMVSESKGKMTTCIHAVHVSWTMTYQWLLRTGFHSEKKKKISGRLQAKGNINRGSNFRMAVSLWKHVHYDYCKLSLIFHFLHYHLGSWTHVELICCICE